VAGLHKTDDIKVSQTRRNEPVENVRHQVHFHLGLNHHLLLLLLLLLVRAAIEHFMMVIAAWGKEEA
jgi:hypothetical protein